MINLYDDLLKLAGDAKEWSCSLLFNEEDPSKASAATVDSEVDDMVVVEEVDLCHFIAPMPATMLKPGFPKKTNYMFPERFKGMASRMALQVELKLAAIKCGHQLIVRTCGPVTNGVGDREFNLKLVCGCGTTYASRDLPEPTIRGGYEARTQKPTDKAGLCSFTITVFLQKNDAPKFPDRWFLSCCPTTKAKHCCNHKNHFKFDPSHMHVPIKLMNAEEKKLATDCGQLHFTPTSSAALLSLRQESGLHFKASQVDYILRFSSSSSNKLICTTPLSGR
jgi:hypothetical protein